MRLNIGETRGLALGMLLILSSVALILPTHKSYGYGECDAPVASRATLNKNLRKYDKMRLAWYDYDFSVCDDALTTKSYEIQIYTANGELIREKTRTRNDRFSLPNNSSRVKIHKILVYQHDYKFRVRAIANDGTKSGWSDYYEFTTPVEDPGNIAVSLIDYIDDSHQLAAQFQWEAVEDTDTLLYYRFKLVQHHSVAIGSGNYDENTTKLLSKKFMPGNVDSYTVTVADLYPAVYEVGESPYDIYDYTAKLRAVYRIDGEVIKTDWVERTVDFGQSGSIE